MSLYSLKMRASRTEHGESVHISGAEKILSEEELGENAAALIGRALHHAKGEADFINLKIEAAPAEISFTSRRCQCLLSKWRRRRKGGRPLSRR